MPVLSQGKGSGEDMTDKEKIILEFVDGKIKAGEKVAFKDLPKNALSCFRKKYIYHRLDKYARSEVVLTDIGEFALRG
jgi:hypothetical protein